MQNWEGHAGTYFTPRILSNHFSYSFERESANMGVRMKLGLSYLAMVLMIVFLGVFALWSMSNMQKSADDAAEAALKYM